VFLHDRLDLRTGDVVPAGDDQVVGPGLVLQSAVLALDEDVAGVRPAVPARVSLFLRAVPVLDAGRAADGEQSGLAAVALLARVRIDDLTLVARNGEPRRRRVDLLVVTVADEDVQHLRRPDPVQQFDAVLLLERFEGRRRQRFAGAHPHSERGDVVLLRTVGVLGEHLVERRRDRTQDRDAVLVDGFEEVAGSGVLCEARARAEAERERDEVPVAVRERERRVTAEHVLLGRFEAVPSVRVRAGEHLAMRVDRAFRATGRPAGVQHQREVVAPGSGGVEFGARRRHQVVVVVVVVVGSGALGDDDVFDGV